MAVLASVIEGHRYFHTSSYGQPPWLFCRLDIRDCLGEQVMLRTFLYPLAERRENEEGVLHRRSK